MANYKGVAGKLPETCLSARDLLAQECQKTGTEWKGWDPLLAKECQKTGTEWKGGQIQFCLLSPETQQKLYQPLVKGLSMPNAKCLVIRIKGPLEHIFDVNKHLKDIESNAYIIPLATTEKSQVASIPATSETIIKVTQAFNLKIAKDDIVLLFAAFQQTRSEKAAEEKAGEDKAGEEKAGEHEIEN